MDLHDEFLTVAELAVGIAGFSAVVVAFSVGGRLHERDIQRFLALVTCAANAIALAFVPSLLLASGLSGTPLWQASSGVMIVTWVVGMVPYTVIMRRLQRLPSAEAPPTGMSIAALSVPAVLNLAVQVVNVSGVVWAPGAAAYLIGLLVWLWAAGLLFVAILVNRPDA